MRIRAGYKISYDCPQPTPMLLALSVHPDRLPDHARVDVAFKKPILLPGSVAFGSRPLDDGYAFSLSNPKSGAPHLVGRSR